MKLVSLFLSLGIAFAREEGYMDRILRINQGKTFI